MKEINKIAKPFLKWAGGKARLLTDIKWKEPSDDFFDGLYGKFDIKRVFARRNINSNPSKRGVLTELLITNIQKREALLA